MTRRVARRTPHCTTLAGALDYLFSVSAIDVVLFCLSSADVGPLNRCGEYRLVDRISSALT
jgi:hypothetical protein